MPLLMQVYTSPDYRSPLDLNAKVQSDKRIYAEVRRPPPSSSPAFSSILTHKVGTGTLGTKPDDAHFTSVCAIFVVDENQPAVCRLCLVQISGHTFGSMALTIKVISCFLHSKGSCPVVKELPFMTEACSLNSCPNSTRLSFSLDHIQELTSTTWDVECSVNLCFNKVRRWVFCLFLSFFFVCFF